jgi:hypothetical protein
MKWGLDGVNLQRNKIKNDHDKSGVREIRHDGCPVGKLHVASIALGLIFTSTPADCDQRECQANPTDGSTTLG